MEDNFRKMAPGAQTPAYFVTVIKDKTPKGFYWMANTNKSYDMLKAAKSLECLECLEFQEFPVC